MNNTPHAGESQALTDAAYDALSDMSRTVYDALWEALLPHRGESYTDVEAKDLAKSTGLSVGQVKGCLTKLYAVDLATSCEVETEYTMTLIMCYATANDLENPGRDR